MARDECDARVSSVERPVDRTRLRRCGRLGGRCSCWRRGLSSDRRGLRHTGRRRCWCCRDRGCGLCRGRCGRSGCGGGSGLRRCSWRSRYGLRGWRRRCRSLWSGRCCRRSRRGRGSLRERLGPDRKGDNCEPKSFFHSRLSLARCGPAMARDREWARSYTRRYACRRNTRRGSAKPLGEMYAIVIVSDH